MESIEDSLIIKNSNLNLKKHKKHIIHYNSVKKIKNYRKKVNSSKNNLISRYFEGFQNNSRKKESKSHNRIINYKRQLFKIFYAFLKKKKFKLSNKFDAKHSKKFLDKKDKCLGC